MGYIDITQITLSPAQSINRNVDLEYKLDSDPDSPENWIYINNVVVPPSGILSPSETITGLEDNTSYTLRATTECGSASYTETVSTPNFNIINATVGDYVQATDFYHEGLMTSLTIDGQDMSKTIIAGGSEGFPLRASNIDSDPLQFNFAACAYTTSTGSIDVEVGVDINGETGLYLRIDGKPDQYTPTSGTYYFNDVTVPFPLDQGWYPNLSLLKDEDFTTTTTTSSTSSTTTTSTTGAPFVSFPAFVFDWTGISEPPCDYDDFPTTFYGKVPSDGKFYTDTSFTTLAPTGYIFDTNDLVIRRVSDGTFLSQAYIYTPGSTFSTESIIEADGGHSAFTYRVYIKPGQTVRATYTITSTDPSPSEDLHIGLVFSSPGEPDVASPYTTSSVISLDYSYNGCECARVRTASDFTEAPSVDTNVFFDVTIELV